MYEREMCVTADKIYIFDKSVINTRTILIVGYPQGCPTINLTHRRSEGI